jgi:pyruvate/oxaloacetate carboxyltransferase
MLQTAHAEQVPVLLNAQDQLVIHLPEIDHETLAEQVRTLRSQLIERKQKLVQIVADKKLDGGIVIITAIMPGGLLYAGYKQIRYEQAMSKLARVNADIEEFSSDLLALSRSVPVAIAQLNQ